MKSKTIKSLECKFVSGTYKFFYSDYSDPLENMKVIKPIIERVNKSIQSYLFLDDFAFEGFYYDDKDTICYVVPFCKHCNSFNVIRKDFNTRRVYNKYGKLVDLKLKRYECKDCGRKSQTELFNAYDSYSRIPNHVKEKIALGLHNGDKTLFTTG